MSDSTQAFTRWLLRSDLGIVAGQMPSSGSVRVQTRPAASGKVCGQVADKPQSRETCCHVAWIKERNGVRGTTFTGCYRDTEGRERSAGSFSTRRAAERAAQREEQRVLTGAWHDATRGEITFTDYVEHEWLPNKHLETSTLAAYRQGQRHRLQRPRPRPAPRPRLLAPRRRLRPQERDGPTRPRPDPNHPEIPPRPPRRRPTQPRRTQPHHPATRVVNW